jgi:hypothetical protein
MAIFRKKPVVIDAFQWTAGPDQREDPEWIVEAIKRGTVHPQGGSEPHLTIHTLGGVMRADVGDWIIRGWKGEIYPCKPDIFEATYEPVAVRPQAPLIHLNGTSPVRLRNGLEKAYAIAGDLDDALREAGPNRRDYYPLEPEAWRRAEAEHCVRMQRVADIRREIEEIVAQIDEQKR